MREIKVTESGAGAKNLGYVSRGVSGLLGDLSGREKFSGDSERSALTLKVAKEYEDIFRGEIEDRIADVIAVRYKYAFFKRYVRTDGLNELETELLRAALIAADLDEDKRYIVRRLRSYGEYAIDGIYNFRLAPLKKKWRDIVGYIPPYFTDEQLNEFVSYLMGEKRNKRVLVENDGVYDSKYNKLDRTSLTCDMSEGKIVREVILSASGSVAVRQRLDKTDEKYIRRFFGSYAKFV